GGGVPRRGNRSVGAPPPPSAPSAHQRLGREGRGLVYGTRGPAPTPPAREPEPHLAELLGGSPPLVAWIHGLMALTGGPMAAYFANDPRRESLLFWLSHITEVGVALHAGADGPRFVIRAATTFANPDDVVAALEPLLYRAIRG